MLNIRNFKSEIATSGTLPVNRYLISFAAPPAMRGAGLRELNASFVDSSLPLERISLRCEAAQIPGVSFTTIDGIVRYGYGASETIPYNSIFEDLNLTFLVDQQADIHRFFHLWMNAIVNMRSHGHSNMLSGASLNGMKAYEVGYQDRIVTDISIMVYAPSGQKVLTAKAYRAYPKHIPAIDLNWSSENELMKFMIPFSYTDFDITYENNLPAGSPVESSNTN